MLRSMPVVLLFLIAAVSLVNPYMPLSIKMVMYAISLSIKSGILFVLPFIIFSLIFKMTSSLSNKGTALIAGILLIVCASNFTTAFLSHFLGEWVYHFHINLARSTMTSGLLPAWDFAFPVWIKNNVALFSAIIGGVVAGRFFPVLSKRLSLQLDKITMQLLFAIKCIIPLFIAGFLLKLENDGIMHLIIQSYSVIFVILALTLFSYLFLIYFFLNQFDLKATLKMFRGMFVPAIAGFSAMSSAAAMPLTIAAVKENTENKALAASVVPMTVNIHLLGDCVTIPVFAYALMKGFGMPMPLLSSYLIFLCYFVMAKFSIAAVPGGGIIVMLPILEAYLGFTPEMLSLITALYILFDPVITCANVLGNGAFAKLIDRLSRLQRKEASTEMVLSMTQHE